jgi:hypothetical protein
MPTKRLKHGTGGYVKRGCRCDVCRGARAAWRAQPHVLRAQAKFNARYNASKLGKAAAIRRRMKYRDKVAARSATFRAVARGDLVKPKHCQRCRVTVIEAHHLDYSRPLYVRWLCRRHHRAAHGI